MHKVSRQIVVNLGKANLQKAAVIKFNVLLLVGGWSSYLMKVWYKKSKEKRDWLNKETWKTFDLNQNCRLIGFVENKLCSKLSAIMILLCYEVYVPNTI